MKKIILLLAVFGFSSASFARMYTGKVKVKWLHTGKNPALPAMVTIATDPQPKDTGCSNNSYIELNLETNPASKEIMQVIMLGLSIGKELNFVVDGCINNAPRIIEVKVAFE